MHVPTILKRAVIPGSAHHSCIPCQPAQTDWCYHCRHALKMDTQTRNGKEWI